MNIAPRRTGVSSSRQSAAKAEPVSIFVLIRAIRVKPVPRKNKNYQTNPFSNFAICLQTKGIPHFLPKIPVKNEPIFHVKIPIAKPISIEFCAPRANALAKLV
jgi:hypothetical protein